MTRQEKVEMVAGTSGHTIRFIEALTKDNESLLNDMVTVAKLEIANETADQVFEAMA